MSPESERLPPQNLDAERSVLGSMLRDNHAISDVVNVVRAEHFYTDAHQKIFQGIVTLYINRGQPADLVTLAEYLKQEKQIEDTGGYPYLAELWDAAPTAANAEFYAKIVRDKGMVRSLIHASNEILRDAYDQTQPAEELLGAAESKIFEIANRGVAGQTYTIRQVLEETYDRIDKRVQGHQSSDLETGFVDLDEKTAGLHNSELVILAARPSVGKTALALNIARHITVEQAQPVFFVSLEMSRIELAERLLCCQAKVDGHRLRKGTLGASSDDMDRLIAAGGDLRRAKLFIDDSPAQNMLRIAANARRLQLREGIRLVIIDYLQLIEPENRRDPRQEQVAQTSRRLKFLAKELNIPVMALAQVNRASEDRQDHRPRLADLRESGSIEQDADTVLMLHRPEMYEPGQHAGAVELIIAKQRNGPTGEIMLTFQKEFLRFENFAAGIPFEG